MDFTLTGEQVALRDAVRDLLTRRCPPDLVRTADAEQLSLLWGELGEMGVFGTAVPEPAGGLGLNDLDLIPLLEEIGYAAVPLPVAETAAVAAPLLAAAGDPHGQLPGVLAGTTRIALAAPDSALVPYAQRADLILVLADDSARLAAAATAEPESMVDPSRAAATVALGEGGVLTTDAALIGLARRRADLAAAAQLIGLGRRMLELTAAYVGARRQFGVPVGSFQAVKHQLADALLRLEFAAPPVLAAAWALAQRAETAARDVSMAVLLASEAAQTVARAALQCHGAIGYTVEYDLHLYAKRTWALLAGADTDRHLACLAGALDLIGVDHE